MQLDCVSILMGHQYDIRYRRSADHANANVLSRFIFHSEVKLVRELPVSYFTYTDDLPVSAWRVRKETLKDQSLSRVQNYNARDCSNT